MKLSIYHHKTFFTEGTPEEEKALVKAVRIWHKNFHDQLVCVSLFKGKDKSFPTGYLNKALAKLKKNGIEPELVDCRKYPAPYLVFSKKNNLPPLWSNQVEALALIEKNPFGIVSSTTGSGKSRLILETFFVRRVKTLIVVPSITIQKQLYKDFCEALGKKFVSMKAPKFFPQLPQSEGETPQPSTKKKIGSDYSSYFSNETSSQPKKKMGSGYFDEVATDIKPKKIGGSYFDEFEPKKPEDPENSYLGRKESPTKIKKWQKKQLEKKYNLNQKLKEFPVTILCFQGLDEVPKDFLESIRCVIVDECHHASAKTIRDSLLQMSNAAYRYGFSATPWRDNWHEEMLLLSALGDNTIYDFSAKKAVEMGIIAKPKLEVINSPTPDKYLMNIKHWRTILESGIIGNKKRNKAIVERAQELFENGNNVLICVDEIAHLEILQERLKQVNITPLIIHGQMNDKEKDENVKSASESKDPVVSIATMAVGEGANLVNVNAVILAGGGKGSIRLLQRIGRGTRKTDTKSEMLVVDFNDWFNPTLSKHSKMRKSIFKKTFGDE